VQGKGGGVLTWAGRTQLGRPVVTLSRLVASSCPLDLTGTRSVGDMASFLVVNRQCGRSMGNVGSCRLMWVVVATVTMVRQWWPGVVVDGGLRKREEVCVCVRLRGVFVFGYKLRLRLVTLVFCRSSRSSNFGNRERPKTRPQLWSSMVLGISGLGQSWSSPVSVFFQSWDWTSKHYV